jgi:sialate O-acetylesterase
MLTLPSVFSHGMILNKTARIWGWSELGSRITLRFLGKTHQTDADAGGRFEFTVTADEYGGPHVMDINGTEIRDIYVGRVWLCGGQSNMELPLRRTRPLLDAHITPNPSIRVFQSEKTVGFGLPRSDVNGRWTAADEQNLEEIFAVPYFFASELLKTAPPNCRIGLLCAAAGGTPAEAWLPEEIITRFPLLHDKLTEVRADGFVERRESESGARISEWNETLRRSDMGVKDNWHTAEYDDSGWETRMLLDDSDLPEHGAVWYRLKVHLGENETESVHLYLGRVIDSVQIYVNGRRVVGVDYQYPPCFCAVPAELLRTGENVIAVRAVGEKSRPRFIPDKPYRLITRVSTDSRTLIDLNIPWKRRTGCAMPRKPDAEWFFNRPTCVYNTMLAPLLGYSVDGVIWYQGESNVGDPASYPALFTAFIGHVRSYYHDGLPFIYTQLANYKDTDTDGENWAQLREHQRRLLEIPSTAMAVTIDCGEWNDLHPQDKKTVGERLAAHGRRLAYSQDIVSDGPSPTHTVCQNDVLTVFFNHAEGLWANGRPLIDIIDEVGKIHRIYAEIRSNALSARLNNITAKFVRFGWTDCPAVVLYNAHNLPASPFCIPISHDFQ